MNEGSLCCDFSSNHLNHNVGSRQAIIQRCKQASFMLQREVKFFVDIFLDEYNLTREAVVTHYIQPEPQSKGEARAQLEETGTGNDNSETKAHGEARRRLPYLSHSSRLVNKRKMKQKEKEEVPSNAEDPCDELLDEEINMASQNSVSDSSVEPKQSSKLKQSNDQSHSETQDIDDEVKELNQYSSCFSPSREPLAINFFQEIIYLEQKLAYLDKTLNILLNCGRSQQNTKFPQIFKEKHDHLDFMQKINYLSSIEVALRAQFSSLRNRCLYQRSKLDKQLLKIFYLQMQVEVVRDSFYDLDSNEQRRIIQETSTQAKTDILAKIEKMDLNDSDSESEEQDQKKEQTTQDQPQHEQITGVIHLMKDMHNHWMKIESQFPDLRFKNCSDPLEQVFQMLFDRIESQKTMIDIFDNLNKGEELKYEYCGLLNNHKGMQTHEIKLLMQLLNKIQEKQDKIICREFNICRNRLESHIKILKKNIDEKPELAGQLTNFFL